MLETDEDEHEICCRICFCSSTAADDFVTPCECKGSQKYVHLSCLRRWQRQVMKTSAAHDRRAYNCSVCQSKYTYPPPKPQLPMMRSALFSGVTTALMVALFAFYTCGCAPWPHIAALLLLLLAIRFQPVGVLLVLSSVCLLAALYLRGLKLVFRTDLERGLGVALIRYGAPIADLQPGVLLVASRDLDNTMFRRSVILVYEHGLRGAKGVMLTQPRASTGGSGADAGAGNAGWTAASAAVAAQRAGAAPRLPPRYIQPVPPRESAGSQKCDVSVGEGSCREGGSGAAAANSSGGARKPPPLPIPAGTRLSNATAAVAKPAAGTATAASHQRALPIVQHYVGGPVGRLASRRAPQESLLLHSVPGVPGARRMLPSRPSPAAASAAAGSPAVGPADILRRRQRAAAAAVPLELFLGGSLEEVLEIAQAFSSETGGASRQRGGGGDPATASAAAAAARGQVSGDLGHQVKILHGLCSWAPGQLEGELRSGAWGYAAAEASDVWGVRPERLWEAVLASERLSWF